MCVCVCGVGGGGVGGGVWTYEKSNINIIGNSEEDYPLWTMENIFLRDIQYSD